MTQKQLKEMIKNLDESNDELSISIDMIYEDDSPKDLTIKLENSVVKIF